ncbi:uncharacterized protein LOC135171400 [Diachasmimorpha longicaudata]|uniref:uncharacterized protein LOC135171400 n=1 Tax=Diachasmimorpha longicaudata TaxID=58733 RepID=UPI0030B8827C
MRAMNKLVDFSVNYILIILRTSSNLTGGIERILQHAWNQSMSNILIVENRLRTKTRTLAGRSSDNSHFLTCGLLKCHGTIRKIKEDRPVQVIMHQFNFFTKKFYHQQATSDVRLFPNFADNMHGHAIRIQYSDTTNDMIDSITRTLNVTTLAVTGFPSDQPADSYEDFLNTSLVDIFSLVVLFNDTEFSKSRLITIRPIVMLMPNEYEFNNEILNGSLVSGTYILLILMAVWIVTVLLKFHENIWKFFAIFSLIFSIGMSREPSKNHERILFIVVTTLGFMYSNEIYASFTNLGIDPLVEKEYDTFEQIDEVGLPIISTEGDINSIYAEADGAKLNLRKKTASPDAFKDIDCAEMAALHHNVSCLMYKAVAEDKYWFYRDGGRHRLKIGKPIFCFAMLTAAFRHGLPGKKKMNVIVERYREMGLMARYYSLNQATIPGNEEIEDNDAENKSTSEFLRQIIVLTFLGHSFAVIVFIGECLVYSCSRSPETNEEKVEVNQYGSVKREMKRQESWSPVVFRIIHYCRPKKIFSSCCGQKCVNCGGKIVRTSRTMLAGGCF